MTVLISGGCKNGKSSFAQELALRLSRSRPEETGAAAADGRPVYFATMIPHDGEDDARIERHRADRRNLGFRTIECGRNIERQAESCAGRVVLLDSVTALVANELFDGRADFDISGQEAGQIAGKIKSGIAALIEKAASVIFVSDTVFCDGKIYGETTELYRRILAQTENFIAASGGRVYEMTGGGWRVRMRNDGLETADDKLTVGHLVIGGAYQGKTAWAAREFSLDADDICVCTESGPPDFSKRCLAHYENYVAFCLKNNLPPRTDFAQCADSAGGQKIIICDDIFCGIVPCDPFQRRLREETGLALQKIARTAVVTRIFCGIAERIQKNAADGEAREDGRVTHF